MRRVCIKKRRFFEELDQTLAWLCLVYNLEDVLSSNPAKWPVPTAYVGYDVVLTEFHHFRQHLIVYVLSASRKTFQYVPVTMRYQCLFM